MLGLKLFFLELKKLRTEVGCVNSFLDSVFDENIELSRLDIIMKSTSLSIPQKLDIARAIASTLVEFQTSHIPMQQLNAQSILIPRTPDGVSRNVLKYI